MLECSESKFHGGFLGEGADGDVCRPNTGTSAAQETCHDRYKRQDVVYKDSILTHKEKGTLTHKWPVVNAGFGFSGTAIPET
jgi:hypothetical protein